MKDYLYPQNMKAEASMWLWTMRDFIVVAAAALISCYCFNYAHLLPGNV